MNLLPREVLLIVSSYIDDVKVMMHISDMCSFKNMEYYTMFLNNYSYLFVAPMALEGDLDRYSPIKLYTCDIKDYDWRKLYFAIVEIKEYKWINPLLMLHPKNNSDFDEEYYKSLKPEGKILKYCIDPCIYHFIEILISRNNHGLYNRVVGSDSFWEIGDRQKRYRCSKKEHLKFPLIQIYMLRAEYSGYSEIFKDTVYPIHEILELLNIQSFDDESFYGLLLDNIKKHGESIPIIREYLNEKVDKDVISSLYKLITRDRVTRSKEYMVKEIIKNLKSKQLENEM